jgi:hypothetical protein
MSETDVVEEKAAKAEAAAEPKEERKVRSKDDSGQRQRRNQRSNNRNKGRGGNNRGRHNKQQDPNMNEDDLPPVATASEPVDLSDVELTDEEKTGTQFKGAKNQKN